MSTPLIAPEIDQANREVGRLIETTLRYSRPKGTKGLLLFKAQFTALIAKGFTRRQVYENCVAPYFVVSEPSFYRWARCITEADIEAVVASWNQLLNGQIADLPKSRTAETND